MQGYSPAQPQIVLKITYPELPVAARKDEIFEAMQKSSVVVVVGETGSGKTTQLPKMALELAAKEGREGLVGCTQPRRLAATSVARRVAEELAVEAGSEVGYEVRFDKRTSENTVLKFMTDGILLAELQNDRLLKKYHTLIIDEAHERSLNIDFLLGMLRRITLKRKDLRVIISSATLDAGQFSDFYNQSPQVFVEGRTFPVEDHFLPPLKDEGLSDHVLRAVDWVGQYDASGDVLVFLPGEREIRETERVLQDALLPNTETLAVFARLSMSEQQRVFTKSAQRRVVLATNVAETSLTIPGIVYVIDSGLARVSRWSPQRGIQRLQIEQISQASARQRRGRCGRVRAGVCVKLYDEETLIEAPEFTDPEIRRSSLAGVILKMKGLGLGEVSRFPFLDPPNKKAVQEGLKTLEEVDALDEEGRNGLSDLGWRLSRLPLDPRLARMLIEAEDRGILGEILVVVAGLTLMDVRERPEGKEDAAQQAQAKFLDAQSDFISLLKIWNAVTDLRDEKGRLPQRKLREFCRRNFCNFRRLQEWEQLVRELRRNFQSKRDKKKDAPDPLAGFSSNLLSSRPSGALSKQDRRLYQEIHCALLVGMPRSVGCWDREAKNYKGVGGMRFAIFPGSGLFRAKKRHAWVLAFELVETSRLWARRVAWLEPEWVEKVAPHLCRKRYHSPEWNEQQGAVYGKETVLLGGLTLVPGRPVFFNRVSPKAAHEVFVREAILGGRIRGDVPCLRQLSRVRSEVARAEQKLRRVGGLWSEEHVFDYYFSRIPVEATTAKNFHNWRKENENEKSLMVQLRDVVWDDGVEGQLLLFPDEVRHDGCKWAVEYVCDPEAADDGVNFIVDLDGLVTIPDFLPSWVVPGIFEERVEALIRSLPKVWRARAQPVRETAEDFVKEWTGWEPRLDLVEALGAFLSERFQVEITPSLFAESAVRVDLRPGINVRDERGESLAWGESVIELRETLHDEIQLRRQAQANREWEMTGGTYWSFGEIPLVSGEAFPALVDEGETVGMRAFLSESDARESHRRGVMRLFWLDHLELLRGYRKRSLLQPLTKLIFGPLQEKELEEQLLETAVEAAFEKRMPTLPRSSEEFATGSEFARGWVLDLAHALARELEYCAQSYDRIQNWLAMRSKQKSSNAFDDTIADLEEELAWLTRPQFIWRAGAERCLRYRRYFDAIEERIGRLESLPLAKDEEKRRQLDPLWLRWRTLWLEDEDSPRWWEIGWLLSEWRIQLFAPQVPRREKVGVKKLEKLLWA